MAFFIAVEGIDGAGKTTQVKLLALRIKATSPLPLLVLHEPGSTALGEQLRQLLKGEVAIPVVPRAELLLFAAARAQLLEEQIRPFLARGGAVLCDRFSPSTLAYQGYGRGLDLEQIACVQNFATQGISPDVTLLLDVPVNVGLKRKREQRAALAGRHQLSLFDTSPFDRFEDEATAFHERVRQGYLKLAAGDGAQYGIAEWRVVDGTRAPDVVAKALWAAVEPLLSGGNRP